MGKNGKGEGMEEKELTREEKIETLKVFAGMTEEQKSIFSLGVMIGEHKAKYGVQPEAAAQPA